MPSVSQSQQRLFGMVHAYQTGRLKNPPAKIKQVAGGISKDDATDFAKTKYKNLPDRITEEKQGGSTMTPGAKVAAYLRNLANRIPVGVKAAEAINNLQGVNRLQKLASAVERTGHLPTAVNEVYRDKSAEYRRKIVVGLCRGLGIGKSAAVPHSALAGAPGGLRSPALPKMVQTTRNTNQSPSPTSGPSASPTAIAHGGRTDAAPGLQRPMSPRVSQTTRNVRQAPGAGR